MAPVELGLCCQFRPPQASLDALAVLGCHTAHGWQPFFFMPLGTSVGRLRYATAATTFPCTPGGPLLGAAVLRGGPFFFLRKVCSFVKTVCRRRVRQSKSGAERAFEEIKPWKTHK